MTGFITCPNLCIHSIFVFLKLLESFWEMESMKSDFFRTNNICF